MDRPGFVSASPAALSAPSQAAKSTRALHPLTGAATAPVLPTRVPAPVSAPSLHTELCPAHLSSGHLHDGAVGKGSGTVVVLFRSDLRLDDHPALSHAVEEAARVVPVYCFDPRHFGRTDYGFEKTGKYRAKFLLESVSDLREALQKKGADLVVRHGKPEAVLPDLCKRVGAKEVFVHHEVTYEEQEVEADLAKALKENGASLRTFWANTLYHEDDLPFDIESMPDVYSDFRESVERNGTIRAPLPAPESLPQLPRALRPGEIPTLSALGIRDPVAPSDYTTPAAAGVSTVTGGESEAMLRVRAYVDEARRFDAEHSPRAKVTAHLGADFSCRISPWLALGCISPRRIFDELKKAAVRPDMLLRSTTYYELVWRDFFRCITAKYSSKRSAASRGGSRRKSMANYSSKRSAASRSGSRRESTASA